MSCHICHITPATVVSSDLTAGSTEERRPTAALCLLTEAPGAMPVPSRRLAPQQGISTWRAHGVYEDAMAFYTEGTGVC